jgi:glucokinase
MNAFAVDLGGTHATCALIEGKRVVAAKRVSAPAHNRLVEFLPTLSSLLKQIGSTHPKIAPSGIGLGFCGLVDCEHQRIADTNGKFVDAKNIDLAAWAMRDFGLPLRVENDARLALLGEHYAGAAQGIDDVAMFTLGTGIGGAILSQGRIVRGPHQQAGLLGHIPVRIGGRVCSCGSLGCAESEASGWALPTVASEWPDFGQSALAGKELNFKNLFDTAAGGDAVAQQIQQHCFMVWAMAAIGAVHVCDPSLIVFGGGVAQSGHLFIPFIQEYVARYAWAHWGTVPVRASQLGNQAGLIGAVPLLTQEM